MKIGIELKGVAEVQKMLAAIPKHAKEAQQRWTNWVGIEAQGAMRDALPNRFAMRGTTEGFRDAIVFTQARARSGRVLSAELKVGGPGFGQSRTQKLGVLLARHEEVGSRSESRQTFFDGRGRAMHGLGFFVPARGLRTPTANPPRKLYPSSIGAALRLTPDSRLILAKGTKQGSKKGGTGESYFATPKGIFRRKHTSFGGRVAVDPIWYFVRNVRTPARLKLWETAERVMQVRAIALGQQAIEETLFRATL